MKKPAAKKAPAKAAPHIANDDIGVDKRMEMYRRSTKSGCARSAPTIFSCKTSSRAQASFPRQEGIAAALRPRYEERRSLFCTYRGHAHTLARGVSMEKVLGELMQRDNGLMRGKAARCI